MTQTVTAEHASQARQFTEDSKGWEDAIKAVRQASQNGSLPKEFGQAAEYCERGYQTLPDSDRQQIDQSGPDVAYAVLMLGATMASEQPQQITAVRNLIEQVARQTASAR